MSIHDLFNENNPMHKVILQKMSEETGIPVEQLENSSELGLANTILSLIEDYKTVLAYMGPETFTDTLLTSIEASLSNSSLPKEEIEAKVRISRESISHASQLYYDKIIMGSVKSFIEVIAKGAVNS